MDEDIMKNVGLLAMGALGLGGLLLFGKKKSASAGPSIWPGPAEGFANLEPADEVCDPSDIFPKPGAIMFRDAVISRYGGYDAGIPRACAVPGRSEHHEGRAWDWGILPYQGLPAANVEGGLETLLANDAEILRRAGVMNLIYNRRIWRAYNTPTDKRGWGPYGGASPHTDHVHFSFTRAGGDGLTSWYQNPVMP